MTIETRILRKTAPGEARVLAVFSFRYDAHLVPDLLANIGPAVHGWIAFDDRLAAPALSNEPARRNALLSAAVAAGADWILAVDPDERFEPALAARMPGLARQGDRRLWTFDLREMVAPDRYRIDGLWGHKRQLRLFPAAPAIEASADALHGRWIALGSGLPTSHSHLSIYHLRMMTPRRRAHRRDTYAAADPDRRFQRIGYDYLADDRGMQTETIAPRRRFQPDHVEDDGLWAPGAPTGHIAPDPAEARLRYAALVRQRAAPMAAYHAIADLCARDPGDIDLAVISAQYLAESMTTERPPWPTGSDYASFLAAQSALASQNHAEASRRVSGLRETVPRSAMLALAARLARTGARHLHSPDAAWRRWVSGPAQLHDGAGVPSADIAVVVIGYRAPASLLAAVESLLSQTEPAEIVVVNSGGGRAAEILAPVLSRIRLIEIRERLFVGAARNIGVDASTARVVAFLAADCTASPGWLAARLARHRAGAAAVSTPVWPMAPERLASQAAAMVLHRRRQPALSAAEAVHYGLSYDRRLLLRIGSFAPGLRVGEDTEFNAEVARLTPIVWAPEAVTRHDYPTTLLALWGDMLRRGYRRAPHPPFAELASEPRPLRRLWSLALSRGRSAVEAGREAPLTRRSARSAMVFAIWSATAADMLGVLAQLRRMRRAASAAARAAGLLPQDPAAARKATLAALAEDGQNGPLRRLAGQAGLACADPAEQARGRRDLRAAAEFAPRDPAAILDLARHLHGSGQTEAALAACELALSRAPSVWQFWHRAAQLSLNLGRPAAALFYAQGALSQSPDRAALHTHLGRIHDRLGNPAQAARRHASARALSGPGGDQPALSS